MSAGPLASVARATAARRVIRQHFRETRNWKWDGNK